MAMVLFSTGNLLLVFTRCVIGIEKIQPAEYSPGYYQPAFLSYLYWTYLERHEARWRNSRIVAQYCFWIQGTLMFLFSLPASGARDAHWTQGRILQVGIAHHGFISLYFIFLRADNFLYRSTVPELPWETMFNVVKSDSISSIFHPSSVLRFYHSCLRIGDYRLP